jgi:hypothetical protein
MDHLFRWMPLPILVYASFSEGGARMATWRDDIIGALKRLGGTGSLEDIYAKLPPARKRISNYQSTVRNTLQLHNPKSDHFTGIAAFQNKGWGVWGLHRSAKNPATKMKKRKTPKAKRR